MHSATTDTPRAGQTAHTPGAPAKIAHTPGLTDAHFRQLRELLNDKQDFYFERLHNAVANKQTERADNLRGNLRMLDESDRFIRDNARLIAAAPDYDFAAKHLVAVYESMTQAERDALPNCIVNAIGLHADAIAKAEGATT